MDSSHSHDGLEVIKKLVGALADESAKVREAAMASLQQNAYFNSIPIFDCCTQVLVRGGRRPSSHVPEVYQIMAFTVSVMNETEADADLMNALTKLAASQITTNYKGNLDGGVQEAACSLLVAIGTRLPDLMLQQVFLHLSTRTSVVDMVQTLAEFASAQPSKFTPRLKDVLSQVSPLLRKTTDAQRPIFANAIKCWCEAALQYYADFPSAPPFGSDVQVHLHSTFDLLLDVWATSGKLKVALSAIDSLGKMAALISKSHLKAVFSRLLPVILGLYKRVENESNAYMVTLTLHNLLDASLMSASGPPILDFKDVIVVMNTLLPLVTAFPVTNDAEFGAALKNYNKMVQCFLTVGLSYPPDLFTFLIGKITCQEKNAISLKVEALCVVKHLLSWLCKSWHGSRQYLIAVVISLLNEQDLSIRKRVAELIVVMASQGYIMERSCGELFLEFLVEQCTIKEKEVTRYQKQQKKATGFLKFDFTKTYIRNEASVAVFEKGLLLLTITVPEIETILWPFLFKAIIESNYTPAMATICRCISELARGRIVCGIPLFTEMKSPPNHLPTIQELFARLVVLLHNLLARNQLTVHILTVLHYLAPLFPKNVRALWEDEIPRMKAYISNRQDSKDETLMEQETWDDMIVDFFAKSLNVIREPKWVLSLGDALCRQYELYISDNEHSGLLHRCLGMLLQKVDDRAYVSEKIDLMCSKANIADKANRIGLAKGMGLVAAKHIEAVLEKIKNMLGNEVHNKLQRFIKSIFMDRGSKAEADNIQATVGLIYNYIANYSASSLIEGRINAVVNKDAFKASSCANT
ncbi:hypothetical protein SUGI_0100410 [Cryptomeria japonica]|uniref:protein SHOOT GRAVITROPISM 6 n=1 Tax=Cryptomeria japonica TaxID=3369 RepID=UPI002408B013|nr:protein SHOOT GRAVITROPISM 6 [Cryptomeria japonica]GLJ09031.1 hypothetical protein SUGI_0100410 [Cryptomeria japonica]